MTLEFNKFDSKQAAQKSGCSLETLIFVLKLQPNFKGNWNLRGTIFSLVVGRSPGLTLSQHYRDIIEP